MPSRVFLSVLPLSFVLHRLALLAGFCWWVFGWVLGRGFWFKSAVCFVWVRVAAGFALLGD